MEKLTIALLSGGISSEREVSLNSGKQVYEALDQAKYDIKRYDPKTDLQRLVSDASDIDAALIILHGRYGEDGTVQGLLDLLGIPYQGSGVLGSAIAMNKLISKRLYRQAELPTPAYLTAHKEQIHHPADYATRLGLPLVVKPVEGGSSVGMSIVRSEDQLNESIEKAFEFDDLVVIEKFIEGTELTGGVIGNDEPEALPLIEIVPNPTHEFFDYEAKYIAGETEEICPARVNTDITQKAQEYAIKAHQALSCRGYSRTDMILKDGDLFVLETNTIPGMTATSLFPQAAGAAGMDFSHLLDKLINLAIEDHQKRQNMK